MARKELKPIEWMSDIDRGLEFRKKFGLEERWRDIEAIYYNIHESSVNAGPNIIQATGDALLSNLNVPYPRVSVKPEREEVIESALILEAVDNMLIKNLEIKQEVEIASLYAYLWSVGFLKIGYDSEWGYNPDLEAAEDSGLSLTQFDRQGRRIEFNNYRPGMPWVKAVLPHDIVVPFGTRDLHDAEWIAHRVVRHIDDIKADSKYTNVKGLQPTVSMRDFVNSYLRPQSKGDSIFRGSSISSRRLMRNEEKVEYVELWEIHCARTGKIFVIASGQETGFLRNEVDEMQIDGLPFVDVSFVPRARSLWTTSDALYLWVNQLEMSDIALQASKQRRLSTLKFAYREGAIDIDELDKATSADVGAGFMIKGGQPFQDSIIALTANNNNLQLHQEVNQIRREAREMVGFSSNQLGEFDASSRRTASEANIVDRSSQFRMGRRKEKIATAYTRMLKKINAIIFNHWKSPRIIEVIGKDGSQNWPSITGGTLAGEYSYEIVFSEEGPLDLQTRRQEAAQLYAALRQDPSIDPRMLIEYLSNAYNDPSLRQLFGSGSQGAPQDANLQLPMQGMQGGGGGASTFGPTGQPTAMQ